MSRLNYPNRTEGHRFQGRDNNDLQQNLSYQQLLNLNHDLTKENMQLKNIVNRLGLELKSLHVQFQIKPRDQNPELYHAIGSHPILQQYQNTLMPLLDAYQRKIQEFQQGFQLVHEEFFNLEKKFEEVCKQNQGLKSKLTQKIRELLEVYRNGVPQKMHSDFGQIILEQINEKQKLLVEQNARLQRDYQRHKSESERAKQELQTTKQSLDSSKSKIREYSLTEKQLEKQIQNLKQSSFDLQIKVNEIEGQKRKLEQANERAQSQNVQINKEKQNYRKNLDQLRRRTEKENFIHSDTDQNKVIQHLQTKIAFLEAEQGGNDYPKRLSKLQKQFEVVIKQRNRLKEAQQNVKNKQDGLNEIISELRNQVANIEAEKSALQINESRIKKSLQNLAQKSKNDIAKVKKSKDLQIANLQQEMKMKIQQKDKNIFALEEKIEQIKLEMDKVERNAAITTSDSKAKSSKQLQRTIEKLRGTISLNEQIFKQQIQIFENDLAFLKKQSDAYKQQAKEKNQQLKSLKEQYDSLSKRYQEVEEKNKQLIDQFRRVRNEYEGNLKEKEKQFEEKIREVKTFVQESDARRRSERQRVQESARQYKRVLEEIKVTYEARIRQLQSKLSQSQYRETPSGY